MSKNIEKLLASSEITDPTDFPLPSVAPGLRQLDDALRCSICREFYEAPVTLNCGHCFCSFCIRSALPEKPECPTCRKNTSEVHLRKNPAMESAVKAWGLARPFVLRLTSDGLAGHENGKSDKVAENTDGRGQKRKRQRTHDNNSEDDIQIVGTSTPPSDPSHCPTDSVECPACHNQVPLQTINNHLDSNCQKFLAYASSSNHTDVKHTQKSAWSKVLGGTGAIPRNSKGKEKADVADDTAEHLPKVSYDILKTKQVAEMLGEHGLPTNGDKNTLVARHRKAFAFTTSRDPAPVFRWVIMFNANLDRSSGNRKTIGQLKRELRKWEEDQKSQPVKEEVTDVAAYQDLYLESK
ncbi:Postreplication repair E3 ubiquitin-protein ligase rad18 [Grifola frondosa]|uniref:Postreplication repair E3 ubiquitin-protein ligase RAD18 n=1 Tax=Grifola frondosa TaxID=5627 RepID=A0A1C7ME29_GRIFR|nr:Postreplication repair E3 ubiquitin-protein ligase rad18 [Grifola frondosa]